ncbi:MAG: hypothetical protein SF053_15290 [Bacteroidia bacterium]|nr:hypothetical protein [Bacteroidia bacterium]
MKLTLINQIWVRSQGYNPGSTRYGYPMQSGSDIGIRRYRVQFFGQLTDRVFIYSQFGENNFNSLSDRKLGFFVHDAAGEYMIVHKKLSLGAGLTAWGGFARFCSPAVGSILGVDAPLFLQSTNDVTDQFLRKLGIYAKGKLGKLDYRIAVSDPMAFQRAAGYSPSPQAVSNFSSKPAHKQWSGYFQYQFLDQESNQTPYLAGTYHGKKTVFNLGAGMEYQPQAMWHLDTGADTVDSDLLQVAADVYYDAPIGSKGQALSLYGVIAYFDFGPGYLRNLAVMNPVNGTTRSDVLNGSGNGFPAYGTGLSAYAQAGYKLRDNLIGHTTFMPYVTLQHARYDRLTRPMDFTDMGINWLLTSHTSKLTAAWQYRPIYDAGGTLSDHKNALILQYQTFFN